MVDGPFGERSILFCQRRTLPPRAATRAIQCSGMTGSSLR
jgi:hypothetical protein